MAKAEKLEQAVIKAAIYWRKVFSFQISAVPNTKDFYERQAEIESSAKDRLFNAVEKLEQARNTEKKG